MNVDAVPVEISRFSGDDGSAIGSSGGAYDSVRQLDLPDIII
jgi:hypothetical protein